MVASDLDPIAGKDRGTNKTYRGNHNFTMNFIQCSEKKQFVMNINYFQDLVLPMLPAISDMFCLPSAITGSKDFEKVSFENLQLSTQGAERQRKDLLKTALRFETLLNERRKTCSDKNDSELLDELITKYNGFKANAAIKKWQVSPDAKTAIEGIIVGMTEETRGLLRAHLDFNKWEESGFLA